ncbi:MAG: tetratricopeptide repeat protein [Deltaproteobacteria bacterium]|nr:tetratricopeptide repeat protein [Deltaproteobacteria bacterium]MBW2532636.1 tetratricopeptide repeat protein [Deltaproteobacteria bacterium]
MGLLLTATLHEPARAGEPVSFQSRLEARQLGKEGLDLFEAGRYADALDRFERANAILPAPTLGLRAARCLVELGRWVEASERYLEVSRFELTRRSPQVHFAARREARAEREALLAKIPTLEVDVPDADPDALLVRIGDERLPAAMLGQPQPVDPGKHAVLVQLGTTQVSTSANLDEGDRTRLLVQLPGTDAFREVQRSEEITPHRKWGIVALGVGGGAAAIAAVNGLITLWLHGQLADQCVDGCLPDQHGTNDLYKATGAVTTTAMVIAGVGFATGATLLIVDPGPEERLVPIETEPAALRVSPWVGPGSIGLSGTF